MALPASTAAALRAAGVPFREDEPLLKKTWWRAGGPADGYVEVQTAEALQQVQRAASATGCPVWVLGAASNTLISDRGVRGLVIRLTGDLTTSVEDTPGEVKLGGGLKLVALIRRMKRQGWTGLEFFAGIPGTVGGAVKMNAGTRLGEVSDALVEVGVVHADGAVAVMPAADLKLSYRHSELPAGAIVAWARFRLDDLDPLESERLIDEHMAYRARTQPTDMPTCGSTFRNPEGDHAGRLIDAAGLKGFTIGRARVSPKHANFIENLGGAQAADVRRVIEHITREVWEQHGVLLEPEVQFAGDWRDWDPEMTL